MKIRTRFLLSYLVVALVPLIAVSALFIVVARNTVTDQVKKELEGLATIQQKRVEYRMDQTYSRLTQTLSRTHTRQHMADYAQNPNPAAAAEITQSLQDAVAPMPEFKSMSVLDKNGTVIASTVPSEIGKDRSSFEYFQEGKVSNNIDTFVRGPDGTLEEYLAGPVTVDGNLLGVVVVKASADDITTLMHDFTGLGKTGETVLAEELPNGSARFLGATRFGEQKPLSEVVPGDKKNIPINIALDRRSEFLTDTIDYRGKPVLAATRYMSDPPLGLVVKMDRSEAYSSVYNLILVVTVVLGAVALAVVIASLFLARSITRPITALTEVATAVTAGDLSRRADIVRKDEIGNLALAFNQMSDELQAERADLERKVEERTSELARSNAELDGYAHTVSHDLRGPVSSINLAAAILLQTLDGPLEGGDIEDMRLLAEQIQASTKRSFELIDDLLQLAEAGHEPHGVTTVDLNEIVRRVLIERSERIKQRGANIVAEGDLGSVKANPTHMYLLFNNLIVNAIKHNDDPEPTAIIRKRDSDEAILHRYEITDNGPGIPEKDLPRIFEPFFKGKGGETGVGLATVKKVVESYGGSIRARNVEGGGTSFTFELRDYAGGTDGSG